MAKKKRTVKKSKASKRPAAKKKAPKRAAPKKAASAKKKAASKKTEKGPKILPEKQVPGGTFLGYVEDFFGHVGVIALTLEKPLAVGDTIRVKGHTTDIIQKVESIQIEHASVGTAGRKDAIGIRIVDKARKGDAVYKI